MIPQIDNQLNTSDLINNEKLPSKTYRLNLDVTTTSKIVGDPVTVTRNVITTDGKLSALDANIINIKGNCFQENIGDDIQTTESNVVLRKAGKNLLNITSTVKETTLNGITIKIGADGLITLDGTCTGHCWPDFIWKITNNTVVYEECRYYFPKTFDSVVASFIEVGGTASRNDVTATIAFNDDSSSIVGVRKTRPTHVGKNATGVNRGYLYLSTGDVFNNYQFYIMLEEGDTSSGKYEPFTQASKRVLLYDDNIDIELCGIGDTQDELDLHTGKVIKRINKVVLDGTYDNIYISESELTTYIRFTDYLSVINKPGPIVYEPIYCNKLPELTNQKLDVEGVRVYGSTIHVRIDKTIIGTTAEEINAWLSENPLVIYYKLREPEELQLEPSSSILDFIDFKLPLSTAYIYTPNRLIDITLSYYPEGTINFITENKDRILGYTDDIGAIKQAIYHILATERNSYLIYDSNYGIELEQYIGSDFDYLQTTIQKTLNEALTQDLRINGVTVNQVIQTATDNVYVDFTVYTILGNLILGVNINV